jgi:hypothetical protein
MALLLEPSNAAAFVDSLAARLQSIKGVAGLVVDLEPAEDATCTAATGMAYANLLHRLAVRLRGIGKSLMVYACAWQWHRVSTFFNYDADGLAAGTVVVGITYDGRGDFNGSAAFRAWEQRLQWLQGTGVADTQYVAAGLSTDSHYDAPAVANRTRAIAAAGVDSIHVFADQIPATWVQPLQAFLLG